MIEVYIKSMDSFLGDSDLRHKIVNMILNTPQFGIYNTALLNPTHFYLYIDRHLFHFLNFCSCTFSVYIQQEVRDDSGVYVLNQFQKFVTLEKNKKKNS